jgi:hypothetical protein
MSQDIATAVAITDAEARFMTVLHKLRNQAYSDMHDDADQVFLGT